MAKKILWADDNEPFRQTQLFVLKRYCSREKLDVEFDEASTGEELVEKVLGNSYDLVFTDNQMPPGMHGLLALVQIREKDSAAPIYMVSASKVGQQAVEVGATGYVDKTDRAQYKSGIESAVERHLR